MTSERELRLHRCLDHGRAAPGGTEEPVQEPAVEGCELLDGLERVRIIMLSGATMIVASASKLVLPAGLALMVLTA